MPPPVSHPTCAVYYHCYLIAGWQEMVASQMERLKACGLYDRAGRVTVGVVGSPDDREALTALYRDGDKICFLGAGDSDRAEEFKTLAALHGDACDGAFDFAWYFHTKGITHRGREGTWENVTDWRRYMEYFLLDRWEDALAALSEGADLYGVNWQGPKEGQPYHFSGNFFAASAAYLRRLPTPEFTDRLSNEFWVGQSARRVVCPHRSGVNHYLEPYPEYRYRLPQPVHYLSIPGWFDFAGLYDDALATVPDGGTIVEVGSWLGRSTCYLAEAIKARNRTVRFVAVDTWQGSDNEPTLQQEVLSAGGSVRTQFETNLRLAGVLDRVEPLEMTSLDAAETFPDKSLDFVFIDADHSYEAVLADIRAWLPKVKSGGWIGGHDYNSPGVHRAVGETLGGLGVPVEAIGTSWLVHLPLTNLPLDARSA